jgi:hypothetical protein
LGRLTEFGAEVSARMALRGIGQIKELCGLIRESGEQLSGASAYTYGQDRFLQPLEVLPTYGEEAEAGGGS